MKNIFLLILLLIFLYFISNRYIEKFSVGCQSSEKSPINISGSLTLSTYCKDLNDSCINDSECKSNYCYRLACAPPKCEDISVVRECNFNPTCIWNTKTKKCIDYTPGGKSNVGLYNCINGRCYTSNYNLGNYKNIDDCSKYCK